MEKLYLIEGLFTATFATEASRISEISSPMAEKSLSAARRRVASVTNHLFPVQFTPNRSSSISLGNASSMNDSYHRIHGEVWTREAVWKVSSDESGKEFTDIVYEKAVGEGIAKGTKAFCSGGDQTLRTSDGYADHGNFGHLNVLDLHVQIRRLPKPVIAMVAGYAVGGGHILHMVCDLTIAADNAIFGQTGPKVGRTLVIEAQ